MRFSMTARTLARQRLEDLRETDITRKNVEKVTRYRENGVIELERLAGFFEGVMGNADGEGTENGKSGEGNVRVRPKRNVYPDVKKEKPKKARHNPVGPSI